MLSKMFFQRNSNSNNTSIYIYIYIYICFIVFFSQVGYSKNLSELMTSPNPDHCSYGRKSFLKVQYNPKVLDEKKNRMISNIQRSFKPSGRENVTLRDCLWGEGGSFSGVNYFDIFDVKTNISRCNFEEVEAICKKEREFLLFKTCGPDNSQGGCDGGISGVINQIKKEDSKGFSIEDLQKISIDIDSMNEKQDCKNAFLRLKSRYDYKMCTEEAFDLFFDNERTMILSKRNNCSRKSVLQYVEETHKFMKRVGLEVQGIFSNEYQIRSCHKKLEKIKADLDQIVAQRTD